MKFSGYKDTSFSYKKKQRTLTIFRYCIQNKLYLCCHKITFSADISINIILKSCARHEFRELKMKKIILLFAFIGMVAMNGAVAQVIADGTCGTDLTWTLEDIGSGEVVLNITGEGDMDNYSLSTNPPSWYDYRTQITNVIIGSEVTSIGNYAFRACGNLSSVTIPNTVTIIGSYAFYGCSNLSSVKIPNGVTSISAYTFSGCNALSSVTIPESVTSIGEDAFVACWGLSSVTLPNSVKSIDKRAFNACIGLSSITLPNSITSIGASVFEGCKVLSSIIIPDSITSISNAIFSGCSVLSSVTIPNSVKSIEAYAFSKCSNLSSIAIPDGVTSIGVRAFQECTTLSSIKIPNSLTLIDAYVFYKCGKLSSVTLPNNLTHIENYAFVDCSNLTSITIPENITSIGNHVFQNCTSLATINFNAINCTSMGSNDYRLPVFEGCTASSTLNIGSKVTNIPNYAFYGYSGLKSMSVKAVTPPKMGSSNNFFGIPTDIPVYVPCQSIPDYQGTTHWKTFTNYQCIETVYGCTDPLALSYNPMATISDSELCIYPSQEPQVIPGCMDVKSLNYNPNATEDDNSCVYADEENCYNEEIVEAPVDTVGAKPEENCDLAAGLEILSALITSVSPTDGNNIIAHWEITQNGNTFYYDVEYSVSQAGVNLFYLSIICKEELPEGVKPQFGVRSNMNNVTGYTVSATYNVDAALIVGICQPVATRSFVVYPNPFADKLYVLFKDAQTADIALCSVEGKLLANYRSLNEVEIATGKFPAGVYVVKITANGKTESIRVVKK